MVSPKGFVRIARGFHPRAGPIAARTRVETGLASLGAGGAERVSKPRPAQRSALSEVERSLARRKRKNIRRYAHVTLSV